jgi:hypothetical protein
MSVMTTATAAPPASAPAPVRARRAAHAIALRDVFDIPGRAIAYVVGLSVLTELAALFPLLLVSDRWRPLHPRVLAPLAWTASGVLGRNTRRSRHWLCMSSATPHKERAILETTDCMRGKLRAGLDGLDTLRTRGAPKGAAAVPWSCPTRT